MKRNKSAIVRSTDLNVINDVLQLKFEHSFWTSIH